MNNVEDMSWYEKSGVRHPWYGWEDLVLMQFHAGLGLVPAQSGMVTRHLYNILLSPWFSWQFPLESLILVINSSIIWTHEVKSLLCIRPCNHYQLTLSTAYSEYCIHPILYTPSTTYTVYCIIPKSTVSRTQPVSYLAGDHVVLNSLHSYHCEFTNE